MIVDNLQEFYKVLIIGTPIISVDYGLKKTGIAVSNQERTIAMPIKIITKQADGEKVEEILNLATTYSACGIVIGLPISMNGQMSEQSKIVQKFAENFSKLTPLPIYLQDERLTSKAANSFLKSFGMNRKERNNRDDSVAASMILETVLHAMNLL